MNEFADLQPVVKELILDMKRRTIVDVTYVRDRAIEAGHTTVVEKCDAQIAQTVADILSL